MKIKTLVVGVLQENCYIVTQNNKTIIIDPGDDAKKIIEECGDTEVVEILVTHHHFDHIGALDELKNKYNLEENKRSNYFNYEVITTPGHTSDSISFYFEEEHILFSGDFIFKGTIGRTDLESGSDREMMHSLDKISKYPDDTLVYPGHGDTTILGDEKTRFSSYY